MPRCEYLFDLTLTEPNRPALATKETEAGKLSCLEPIEHGGGRQAETIAELASGEQGFASAKRGCHLDPFRERFRFRFP